MENYHIYDEVGRGKHSVMYKARRKQTIEYVAVKSTEKSRMKKVLNEVQVLHKLNHPNILKFYNWYESRNHIWLIFEFCVGGDLLNLIAQDITLPEESIRSFGRELMAGLYYLHSQGILNCDLKPANILVDEYGVLKLADFGMSRSIPDSMESIQQIVHGSPHYMSPELLDQVAVHSYQSDLWAFGCVLYELRTGKPPFTHLKFTELAEMIQRDDIALPPPGMEMSDDLIDLLTRLLQKDPTCRISWFELLQHQFWTGMEKIEPLNLPKQPLFEKMFPRRNRGEMEEDQFTTSYSDKNSVRLSRIAQKNQQQQALNLNNVNGSYRGNNRKSYRIDPDANQREDIIDLKSPDSQINFYPEEEDEDSLDDDALSNDDGNSDDSRDEKEQERVFFHRNNLTQEEKHCVYSSSSSNGVDQDGDEAHKEEDSSRPFSAPIKADAKKKTHFHLMKRQQSQGNDEQHKEVTLSSDEEEPSIQSGPKTAPAIRHQVTKSVRSDVNQITERFRAGNMVTDTAWQLIFSSTADRQIKPIIFNKQIEVIPAPLLKIQLLPSRLRPYSSEEILRLDRHALEHHLASLQTELSRSESTSAEKLNILAYVYSLCLSTKVATILINSSIFMILIYMLKSEPTSSHSSTIATTTRSRVCLVIGLCIRFASYIAPEKKTLTTSTNDGATAEESSVANVLIHALRTKSNTRLRRRAIASLGELVFYISKLTNQEEEDGVHNQNQESTSTLTPQWTVSGNVVTTLIQCLREGEDTIVQHYAVKTLGNLFAESQSTALIDRFLIDRVTCRLCLLTMSNSTCVGLRAAAGLTLSHLCAQVSKRQMLRHHLSLVIQHMDNPVEQIIQCFNSSGNDSNNNLQSTEALQHSMMNIVLIILSSTLSEQAHDDPHHHHVSLRTKLLENQQLIESVMYFLSSSSSNTKRAPTRSFLKGKALLFLYWAFQSIHEEENGPISAYTEQMVVRLGAQVLGADLMLIFEQLLGRQDQLMKNPYLLQCVLHTTLQLVQISIWILEQLARAMKLRETETSAVDPDLLSCFCFTFRVTHHPFLRRQLKRYINSVSDQKQMERQILQHWCIILEWVHRHGEQQRESEESEFHVFQEQVILTLNCMAEHHQEFPFLARSHTNEIMTGLMPALASFLEPNHHHVDVRIQVCQVLLRFLSSFFTSDEEDQAEEHRWMETFIIKHILSKMGHLLEDESFDCQHVGLKILCLVVDHNTAFVTILYRLGLIEQVLDALNHLPDCKVSSPTENCTKQQHFQDAGALASETNMISPYCPMLIKIVLESKEISFLELYRIGIIPSIQSALRFTERRRIRTCLHYFLEIIYILLYETSQAIQNQAQHHHNSSTGPANQVEGDNCSHLITDGQELLLQNQPLLNCVGSLMRLTASAEESEFSPIEQDSILIGEASTTTISPVEMTTRCIHLMGQLYGTRFYDMVFRIGSAKSLSPKRSYLRYINHAFDTNNERVKLRLLRTLRHALRSRSPSGYAMAIIQSKELFGRIQDLAQANSTCFENDQDQIQVFQIAQELMSFMSNTTSQYGMKKGLNR